MLEKRYPQRLLMRNMLVTLLVYQLEDKIVHYDDAPHLIKKVEEICPSLQ